MKIEFYLLNITNYNNTYYQQVKTYYDHIHILSYQVCITDSGYMTFIVPDFFNLNKIIQYRYYLKNSNKYKLNVFLLQKSHSLCETKFAFKKLLDFILIFEDEKEEFDNYVRQNIIKFNEERNKYESKCPYYNEICLKLGIDKNVVFNSLVLVNMLNQWRNIDSQYILDL